MLPIFDLPYINEHKINNKLYDAIRSENLEDGVLTVLKVLRTFNHLFSFEAQIKDEYTSKSFRIQGNNAYSKGKHQQALILYNRALLSAPKDSLSMKLAYSNRSALLFKENCFAACIRDIDTCMAMGCPPELVGKLNKRKEEALNNIWIEELRNNVCYPPQVKEFFKIKSSNPDVPNFSADIQIIMEPEGPKAYAVTDIKVGTVLALETPYVSSTHPENKYFSCFYCHKMSLNLMPCDGCQFALYCDEICKKRSLDEGHNILCPIIANIIEVDTDAMLAILAVIKLRQNSKSWNEFMSVCCEMDKTEKDIHNMFNTDKPLWLGLNNIHEHFIVGRMYNQFWITAFILYLLETKTDFFPKSHGARHSAIRDVSRIVMNLSLHAKDLQLAPAVVIQSKEQQCYHNATNSSLSSFTRILKISCQPNVLVVAKTKEVSLVAIKPINKGTELTMNPSSHWLEENFVHGRHQRRLFVLQNIICNCVICSGNWLSNKQTLNDMQIKKYQELDSQMKHFKFQDIILFKKLCKGLDILSDVPFSKQFEKVFSSFLRCILIIMDFHCNNVMFDLNYRNDINT